MSTREPSTEHPLSLWHGLVANWQSQVARHMVDTADAAMHHTLLFQRDLTQARSLTEVAAAHDAATRRMMRTLVERTGALTTKSEEIAAE